MNISFQMELLNLSCHHTLRLLFQGPWPANDMFA